MQNQVNGRSFRMEERDAFLLRGSRALTQKGTMSSLPEVRDGSWRKETVRRRGNAERFRRSAAVAFMRRAPLRALLTGAAVRRRLEESGRAEWSSPERKEGMAWIVS